MEVTSYLIFTQYTALTRSCWLFIHDHYGELLVFPESEVRAFQGPIKKWLAEIGEPVSETATWGQIKAVIDRVHGKLSNKWSYLALNPSVTLAKLH